MESFGTMYQGNGGGYMTHSSLVGMPNVPQQGLELKLAPESEQRLTVGDVTEILRLHPVTVRKGMPGLPEQLEDVRGDGSYLVRTYYLSDVVSLLEKARGQPLPDGPLVPLLTVNEVAVMLDVPQRTVYNWSKKGILPEIRLGRNRRYDSSDVKAFKESDFYKQRK